LVWRLCEYLQCLATKLQRGVDCVSEGARNR
jgi:hypothetical protein